MQIVQTDYFAGHVGESFDIDLGGSSTPLTLAQVRPLPVHPFPGMLRAPFALVFRSESQVVLPQKIYRLNNSALGKLDIFLVPVGREVSGVVYEAVFN